MQMPVILPRSSLLDDLFDPVASLGIDASAQVPNVHYTDEARAARSRFESRGRTGRIARGFSILPRTPVA